MTSLDPIVPGSGLEQMRSVEYMLDLHDRLGVPHFQRGLIWGSGSTGALLESIYKGTPCGVITLWKSAKPKDDGLALGPDEPELMIVDGQQRIRSLHEVFREEEDYSEEDGEGRCWCLNLGALEEFKKRFKGHRFSLFRKVANPIDTDPDWAEPDVDAKDGRRPRSLLPVKWFLQRDAATLRKLVAGGRYRFVRDATLAILEGRRHQSRWMVVGFGASGAGSAIKASLVAELPGLARTYGFKAYSDNDRTPKQADLDHHMLSAAYVQRYRRLIEDYRALQSAAKLPQKIPDYTRLKQRYKELCDLRAGEVVARLQAWDR